VIVTLAMVAICVVGVMGAIASVLSYDKPYGELGGPMRIPRHTRRIPREPRPSRQLRAVEAALAQDGAATDQPSPCAPVRAHRRRRITRSLG
jgi:hypothetical protein